MSLSQEFLDYRFLRKGSENNKVSLKVIINKRA